MCDGVRDCADGNDESQAACEKKQLICSKDPYHGGCGKYFKLSFVTVPLS